MANNEIFTRIQLKYDTYDAWTKSPGKDVILLPGELGIVEIAATNSATTTTPPTVLFKVGDGTHAFHELNWASALAADVHEWAKRQEVKVVGDGNAVTAVDIQAHTDGKKYLTFTKGETFATVGELEALRGDLETDTNTQYQIVSVDAWTYKLQKKDKNETTWTDVSEIAIPPVTCTDGTIRVDGHRIGVNIAGDLSGGIYQNRLQNFEGTHFTEGNGLFVNADVDVYHEGDLITIKQVERLEDKDGWQYRDVAEIDLSGYKHKQTPVVSPATNGNAVEFIDTISQNAEGVITATKKKITAADLGLASAMHFIGAYTEAPSKAFVGTANERNLADGDVYLNTANHTEYVYSANKWVELGNEGSHALKSITITGAEGLTGGGTLEANRTIEHAVPAGAAVGNTFEEAQTPGYGESFNIPVVVTDKFGHVVQKSTTTVTLPAAQKASGAATIATVADDVVTLKAGAVLGENHTLANNTNDDITLAKIAKTGSIYDVKEGSTANNGTDKATNPKYLIFNCGSSTTVI